MEKTMRPRLSLSTSVVAFLTMFAISAFSTYRPTVFPSHPQTPESELAAIAKAYLAMSLPIDWAGLERLPAIRWAPLPPTTLRNCLPDGGCYTRQGSAVVGGRSMTVLATGARQMVLNIFFRNTGAPIGEAAVARALKEAGMGADLARCPVRGGAGSTNWYRLQGSGLSSGYLSVQAGRAGRPNEGFVLAYGSELPALQPNQLALYSEQCGEGAVQAPVSTRKPHEILAETLVQLLAPSSGPALYDWQALRALSTGITWDSGGPKRMDLTTLRNDHNPVALNGFVTYAGRKFSLQASGTPTQVKNIYVDENGMHPRGEHLLGVVYERGIAVRMVRCGPVYTESTLNWYSLSSNRTRPAMILQSIRYEGNQVQDSYSLRLDGTLPARDPRDRDPGTNGC
jgi:hypothetical protein